MEEDSGLYYYRLRFYDPDAGRFVSRDPLGMWGDPGQRGNAQNYCGNNPVNRVDPLGLRGYWETVGAGTKEWEESNFLEKMAAVVVAIPMYLGGSPADLPCPSSQASGSEGFFSGLGGVAHPSVAIFKAFVIEPTDAVIDAIRSIGQTVEMHLDVVAAGFYIYSALAGPQALISAGRLLLAGGWRASLQAAANGIMTFFGANAGAPGASTLRAATVRAARNRVGSSSPTTTPSPQGRDYSQVVGPGMLTLKEAMGVQRVSDVFDTRIDVGGSRAAGEGRKIETDLPIGKDWGKPEGSTRSDIDYIYNSQHPKANNIVEEMGKLGGGGHMGNDFLYAFPRIPAEQGTSWRMRFEPGKDPVRIDLKD